MPRYIIFEKTKRFDYKFKDFAFGKTGGDAIQNLRKRSPVNTKSPHIALPVKTFMKYQFNPTSKTIKVLGKNTKTTIWKKPK